ncbi:hypothetical protein [Aestuariivivens sediminicola]|uniref:hypothetical protein n=1 Tax=Aestuariivivens sediminicola TaxID=2913560 RepID=UPI001F571C9B|nr:hypothetical protein [Aestuariivivens sediminicola]
MRIKVARANPNNTTIGLPSIVGKKRTIDGKLTYINLSVTGVNMGKSVHTIYLA